MRIEGIYHPYHAALQKLLSEAITAFGVAVLIDCHSMPRITRTPERAAPDIVLGDRYGTTCAPGLIDLVETIFAGAGLKVARNRPYAGVLPPAPMAARNMACMPCRSKSAATSI
ncbi:N-formylglutamate amidohydrolase [Devosia sp. A8/3-2]|nr:N-formylglutamate amidohydrolase [Devosia sp. A8/3-2]